MRLLNTNRQSRTGLTERLEDFVSDLKVAAATSLCLLVYHHPVILGQVNSLLDGQLSQLLFINMNNLIATENLCRS